MESFFPLIAWLGRSGGCVLDLPKIKARLNVYARIQKRRREIKAYRRFLRAQRLQARIGATYAPSWHPDADPRDQETR